MISNPPDVVAAPLSAAGVVVQTADRAASPLPTGDGHLIGYPAQFFAGAGSASDASIVPLGPADERTDVRITLHPARGHNVSGSVTGAAPALDDLVLRR